MKIIVLGGGFALATILGMLGGSHEIHSPGVHESRKVSEMFKEIKMESALIVRQEVSVEEYDLYEDKDVIRPASPPETLRSISSIGGDAYPDPRSSQRIAGARYKCQQLALTGASS